MTEIPTRRASEPEAVDERTVGELILDADLATREALWDAGRTAAKEQLRSWHELIDAAERLWSAIPDRAGDPTMARVARIADGTQRTQDRLGWPADGAGDAHLRRAASDLARAAELVAARRHPTARLSEAGHLDSEATRTRVMHVVGVATHAMRRSLARYVRDLERFRDRRERVPAGESFSCSAHVLRRTAPIEQLSNSYLRGRWPTALGGEHRDPVPGRLEQAAAGWEVRVGRVLVGSPSAADLGFVAMVERQRALAAELITRSAVELGLSDREAFVDRTRPALVNLTRAWAQMDRDIVLLSRWQRADGGLALAANELSAALREVTHDGAAIASPEVMAGRTDLLAAGRSLQRGMGAGVEVAHQLMDALDEAEWSVPARGASDLYRALGVSGPPVDSAAVRDGRDLPLPQAARVALAAHAEAIIAAAATLDSVGDAVNVSRLAGGVSAAVTVGGRAHEERHVPVTGAIVSGFGCER
ncbi:MAG: hypothetical protein KQH57_11135 [Actinomycetales bacterium]|nr:hypothetical protein [Actinomycetales bacterium]